MIEIPPASEPLPDDVLVRRMELPAKPDVGEVRSRRLLLRAYTAADSGELFAISDGSPVARMGRPVGAYDPDALVWRYMHAGPFESSAELDAFHSAVGDAPDARSLTVVDTGTGALLGSVSLIANAPAHLRVEIGNVWYTPAVQGLGVNRETTRALVDVLFELGYQRIEWKCNSRNLRSRQAAEAMGFTYEGTFDAHMIVKGRRRDTSWYRIVLDDPRR